MADRKALLGALCVSVFAALLTLVPYLYAREHVNQGYAFTGFLLNPWDGFTYLAKMQQGEAGRWGFLLPYAVTPGGETYIYLYYLFLGHLAAWLGADLVTVFHGARFLAAAAMFFLSFLFYRRTLSDQKTTWLAFLLTIFGSGLGWLPVLVAGIETSDIAIPESVPFLLAYANAHFPLAVACMLGALLALVDGGTRLWLRSLIAFLSGTVLAVTLPFSVVSLAAAVLGWLIWDWAAAGGGNVLHFLRGQNRERSIVVLWLSMGLIPWILYDAWVVIAHPVISAWTSQNITPSPPLWHYLAGYGLLLAPAVAGIARAKPQKTSSGRLLIAWAFTGALLLYAPIGLQRRLNLGLFYPLAAMAALGLGSLAKQPRRFWTTGALLVILTLPSNLIVVSAGLFAAAQDEPVVLHTADEVAAFKWMKANIPAGSIVLASPVNGNRLPGLTGTRVLFGHPFETPDADRMRERVIGYYAWDESRSGAIESLVKDGVEFVFFGPREMELGRPAWIEDLPLVARFGDVMLLEVAP
jgi:hypothetical protein